MWNTVFSPLHSVMHTSALCFQWSNFTIPIFYAHKIQSRTALFRLWTIFYSPCSLHFYFSTFLNSFLMSSCFLLHSLHWDKFLIYSVIFFFIRYVMRTRAKLSSNECCCIHCHTEQPFILNKSSSFSFVAFALMLHANSLFLLLQAI